MNKYGKLEALQKKYDVDTFSPVKIHSKIHHLISDFVTKHLCPFHKQAINDKLDVHNYVTNFNKIVPEEDFIKMWCMDIQFIYNCIDSDEYKEYDDFLYKFNKSVSIINDLVLNINLDDIISRIDIVCNSSYSKQYFE